MGKLWLQIVAAAAVAALLIWGQRGGGALAGSVRQVAGTYIRQQTKLPAALGQTPAASGPRRSRAVRAPRYGWPLVGTVVNHPGGGIEGLAPGGAIVRAAAAGTVIAVSPDAPVVVVTTENAGVVLRYAHLAPCDVHRGEAVRLGQVIGAVSHFAPGEAPHLTLQATHGRRQLPLPGLLGSP